VFSPTLPSPSSWPEGLSGERSQGSDRDRQKGSGQIQLRHGRRPAPRSISLPSCSVSAPACRPKPFRSAPPRGRERAAAQGCRLCGRSGTCGARQVASGELKLIAWTTGKRFRRCPTCQSMRRIRQSTASRSTLYGMVYPAGVTNDIIVKTHKALSDVVSRDTVEKQLENIGAEASRRRRRRSVN